MKINKTTMATAAGAALLVAAGVASGLAAGGILGKTAEVFMNSTLPHALPSAAWIGIGAGLGGLAMAGIVYKSVKVGISHQSKQKEKAKNLNFAETTARSNKEKVLHDIRSRGKTPTTSENNPELSGPQYDSKGRYLFG